jgi:hypothetical protein
MALLPFVGFAPVGGVGYEVEDCFGGVGQAVSEVMLNLPMVFEV